jgi:Zn-dependent protease/CBS domain-containing protein
MLWTILFVLSIFGTVFLHELGHALAAKRYNIKTKDITILPIGGVARLEKMPEKPTEELVVALAGPAVNITLALITSLFIQIPEKEALTKLMLSGVNSETFFLYFFIVNIWLAIFNLIPAFPMDGGRVLRALLSFKLKRHIATEIAARIGQLLAIVFVVVGFSYSPVLIFIGIFIFLGAHGESEMVKTSFLLKNVSAKDFIITKFEELDENETIEKAVELLLNSQSKTFLITSDNKAVGSLSRDEIIKALAENGKSQVIHEVMNRNLTFITGDKPVEELFPVMQANKNGLIIVHENNEFTGIIDWDNLVELIMIRNVMKK